MFKKIPKLLFYIVLIMLLIILFFLMLNVTESIRGVIYSSLRPIFYGAVIAYLLKPMCNFFEKRYCKLFQKKCESAKAKRLAHYLSIVTTYIIFSAIIYFVISIIMPRLIKSIFMLVSLIPDFYNSLIDLIQRLVVSSPFLADNIENILSTVYQGFDSWYKTELGPLLAGITGKVMVTFTFILNLFIGFIVSVYLLNGRKKLCAQAKLLIKSIFPREQANAIFNEAAFADKMFSGYFAGTLIDSALVAFICYLLCVITKMPFALLVSFIVGVTNIIPFFGPYIGMIPSAVIILTVSPVKALIFVGMIWLLQQIDGNIIAPKIIGSNTGLSSFWVLFAILLFGGLFGFFGMIIGSPVFAVIYHIVGKLIRKYAQKRGEHAFLKNYEEEFTSQPQGESLRYRFKRRLKRGSAVREPHCEKCSDGESAGNTDDTEDNIGEADDAEEGTAEEENIQISFF